MTDMTTKKPQWGGARKNAGRPATGRKPRKGITLYLNDDEKNKLNAVIIATGKTQTGIFRDAILTAYNEIKTGFEKWLEMIKCELKDIDEALQATSKFCAYLRRKIKKLKTTDDDVNVMAAFVYTASDYLTKIDARVDEIAARDT